MAVRMRSSDRCQTCIGTERGFIANRIFLRVYSRGQKCEATETLSPMTHVYVTFLVYTIYIQGACFTYTHLYESFLPVDAPVNQLTLAMTYGYVMLYAGVHIALKMIGTSGFRVMLRRLVSVSAFTTSLSYFFMRPNMHEASWGIILIILCRQMIGVLLHFSRRPSGDRDPVQGLVALLTLPLLLVDFSSVACTILLYDACYMLVLDYLGCTRRTRRVELTIGHVQFTSNPAMPPAA